MGTGLTSTGSRDRAGWRLTQTLQPADLVPEPATIWEVTMSESPTEPGTEPEARPTEDPEITPSSNPDGGSTVIPPQPSVTNPDADGVDE